MIEITYRAFKFISISNSKPFLLHFSNSIISSFITFYINDFFKDFRDFENLFRFFRDHFFLKMK